MFINIQLFAHKKGQGSSKNGRDSNAQRLGVKRSDGTFVNSGEILMRQKGTVCHPGVNVGLGRDYTLYALISGTVKFERTKQNKKRISVYAEEQQAKQETVKKETVTQEAKKETVKKQTVKKETKAKETEKKA